MDDLPETKPRDFKFSTIFGCNVEADIVKRNINIK